MKILFVAPYVPSRIRVRPYHLVRELARHHDVSVLAVGTSGDAADVAELEAWCRRVEIVPLRLGAALRSCLAAAVQGEPLQAAVCRSPELAGRAARLMASGGFDVVHVEHLRAVHLREVIPPDQPALFDTVDSISLLLERTLKSSHSPRQRLVALLELARTRAYEGRMLPRFDEVTVVSPVDRDVLLQLAPPARITVVPNGVDLEYFQPIEGPRAPATLAFSGKMSYHANATAVLRFYQQVLPLVRRSHPEVRLDVVGSQPPKAVQELARDSAVHVTGYVPDIREALGRATVAICPMTVKVGIQNKVLEAMAMAIPVVATSLGAEGLEARGGEELFVADGPEQMAAQICQLLDSPELQSRVGQAGRRFVETHHRWESAGRQLDELYERAIARHRPQPVGRA